MEIEDLKQDNKNLQQQQNRDLRDSTTRDLTDSTTRDLLCNQHSIKKMKTIQTY